MNLGALAEFSALRLELQVGCWRMWWAMGSLEVVLCLSALSGLAFGNSSGGDQRGEHVDHGDRQWASPLIFGFSGQVLASYRPALLFSAVLPLFLAVGSLWADNPQRRWARAQATPTLD